MNDESLYDGGEVTPAGSRGGCGSGKTDCGTFSEWPEHNKRVYRYCTADAEELDTDYDAGYLWTNFDASGGYEKIFFGYSEMALHGVNSIKMNTAMSSRYL